jgi:hypothetical protein
MDQDQNSSRAPPSLDMEVFPQQLGPVEMLTFRDDYDPGLRMLEIPHWDKEPTDRGVVEPVPDVL